jgi:hypothetical protein
MPMAQMIAINSQFGRQMFGRRPLRDSPHDQDDLGTGQATFRPDSAGEQGIDRPALPTAIFHDRRPSTVVGHLVGWQLMSPWTTQAIEVQDPQQIVMAGSLLHQLADRKLHHPSSSLLVGSRFGKLDATLHP